MKKFIVLFTLCIIFMAAFVFTVPLSAQSVMGEVSLLNVNTYSSYFLNNRGNIDGKYLRPVTDDDFDKFAVLSGNNEYIDTPLEISLLSYYSQPVINIRPVQAAELLPANNPKLAGLKLGAALYQEIQVLRFLGDTAAVGRYENMLKFVSDKNGITRAEIEAYYRNGIRGLVTEAVNEEFNKISFGLDTQGKGSYNTVLTRNPKNGQYTLSYERPSVANDDKILSGQTLVALLSTMSRNSADFSQLSVDTVRNQAALLPAVVYAKWKQIGVAQGVDGTALVIDTLTNFYLNPNRQTFEAVRGIYARYEVLATLGDPFADAAVHSYRNIMSNLNAGLRTKVASEATPYTVVDMAKIPNDPKYNVFATRYAEAQR
ncbi:hypothetical protein FACS189498_2520 [Spirochaetia bacterium]|nr:hypothetical protein FACS189498_2520 [Spirochaetia bacterium]